MVEKYLSKPILQILSVPPDCIADGLFYGVVVSYSKQPSHVWLFLGIFILCLSLRSFFAVPFIYTLFTNIRDLNIY